MNNFGDRVYLDSNILVYAQQQKSPRHETDGRAVDEPLSSAEATNEVRRYCESEQLVDIVSCRNNKYRAM